LAADYSRALGKSQQHAAGEASLIEVVAPVAPFKVRRDLTAGVGELRIFEIVD
jgi:hypothetical protein